MPSPLSALLWLGCMLTILVPSPAARADSLPAGSYVLDPARTEVVFRVRRVLFSEYVGRFEGVTGALQVRPGPPDSAILNVVIQTATVRAGSERLTRMLRGPDFFDVVRFPEIRFVAADARAGAQLATTITGSLTMLGATRPATFTVVYGSGPVDPRTGRRRLAVSAQSTISRSDYGMTAYLPFVGDTVKLDLEGVLVLGSRLPGTPAMHADPNAAPERGAGAK